MTKSEALGYPLMMIASIILLASVFVSAYRDASAVSVGFNDQIIGLVVFVIGFALSALVHILRLRLSNGSTKKSVSLGAINSAMIHASIRIAVPQGKAREHLPPWDFTSASLVGRDNALALAKLRLDLERALREVAFAHDVDLARVQTGVVKLAEMLAGRGVLAHELIEPLRQITSVCNQAIHGYEVSDELADSVVSVGDEMLTRLQGLASTGAEAAVTGEPT